MTRIVVSPKASSDFLNILERLADLAGSVIADRYASNLDLIYERLLRFPEIGSRRPRLGSLARIVVLDPYIVVYDYLRNDDIVHVVRIVDGRRNITRRLI